MTIDIDTILSVCGALGTIGFAVSEILSYLKYKPNGVLQLIVSILQALSKVKNKK